MSNDMFELSIEDQCRAAMERIAEFVNRSAGQHHRRIREAFTAAGIRLLGAP